MHSQSAEDDIIAGCFPEGFTGTMLEVGAWDPVEFSNSRLLIQKGWNATLVEFSPRPVEKLVREYGYNDRVRIIQAAITPINRHVERFHITEDALSTDSDAQVERWKNMREGYNGGFYGQLWVPTLSLAALLSQFFGNQRIHVVSLDVEGSSCELAIAMLESDHRPKVLCAEHDGRTTEIMRVARPMGYTMIEHNQQNAIFLCEKWGKL